MGKYVRVGLGVLLVLVGVLWTLQGLGFVGTRGQGMTGSTVWAIVGPIVAIVGGWLVVRSLRVRR